MDQDNNTEISLIDLFAYLVKKFWVLLIGALIGSALLLSFKLLSWGPQLVSESNASRILQMKLDFMDEVETDSPLFKGEELYCSKVAINVSSNENVVITKDGETLSAIGLELESFWKNLDVAHLVGSTQANDVLKASMVFKQTGLLTTIAIYSNDKAEAERFATAILTEFSSYLKGRETTGKVSYTSISTSSASRNDIAEALEQFETERKELQDEEAIVAPKNNKSTSIKQLVKYALLGFLAGGVVTALIFGIRFVSRNPITSSFAMENTLGVPFLGAVFIDNSLFSKLARKIIWERCFKSDDEAEAYLNSSFSSKSFISTTGCKKIAILSSSNDKSIEERASKVIELLENSGFNASFIGNSTDNPATKRTLEDSDAVILMDKQWVSKMNLVKVNMSMSDAAGKQILGSILC